MIAGRTVTSPPLRHRLSAAPLCRRYTIEMPALGARQRGLTQPTLLTKLALPKGCRLDPGVALPVHVHSHIARVRCPSLRCVDTWMPPCIAHYPNTDILTKLLQCRLFANPLPQSASLHTCARVCTLMLSEHGRALATTQSRPVSPGAHPYKKDHHFHAQCPPPSPICLHW
jgi:hypothetical protein